MAALHTVILKWLEGELWSLSSADKPMWLPLMAALHTAVLTWRGGEMWSISGADKSMAASSGSHQTVVRCAHVVRSSDCGHGQPVDPDEVPGCLDGQLFK